MRVCMLAYTFYESDNRVRRYAETLAKRGDDVEAVVLRREGQPAEEMLCGVRVRRIQYRVRNETTPVTYLFKILAFFLRSAWLLAIGHLRRRYDFIHVHSVPDFEVFATLVPRLAGAKVILDIHDIVPEFYASKFGVSHGSLIFKTLVFIEWLSATFAHHVIIANHLWYDTITGRSVTPDRCTAMINYPDPSIFRVADGQTRASSPDEFVMCYPGTLNYHQGVDRGITAVNLLRDELPNLQFLILGDGPDRPKLEGMVRDLNLAARVKVLGTVPIEQVASTMASVDLGVVPKRSNSFGDEAFSTKILEFMAMGVPVIAPRTKVDQYYFSGDLVQFFDSNSVEDLAAQIRTLASDPARREHLRQKGLEFIRSNNWGVKHKEYLDLVDSLTTSAARPLAGGVVRNEH